MKVVDKTTVYSFLNDHVLMFEHSQRPERQLAVPAIRLLLRSRFLKDERWVDLKELAQDLRQLNWRAISLAKKHPDLFDNLFILSRRAENAVYGALITLLNEHVFTWRKRPPVSYIRPLSYYDDIILGRATDKASEDAP
jgi:hypothetical protein